jgi:hypothetical protein
MASSNNDKYDEAKEKYDEEVKKYTGSEGYGRSYINSLSTSQQQQKMANAFGKSYGTDLTNTAANLGRTQANKNLNNITDSGSQIASQADANALAQDRKDANANDSYGMERGLTDSRRIYQDSINNGLDRGRQINSLVNSDSTTAASQRAGVSTSSALNQSNRMNDNANRAAQKYGEQLNADTNRASQAYSKQMTSLANQEAQDYSRQMNKTANEEAQRYATRQADIAAANARTQATTAARAAGMNKAQAAMMGAQQANSAYQNAYANAYSQQLNNAQGNLNTNLANSMSAQNTQLGNAQQNYNTQLGSANSNQNAQLGNYNSAYDSNAGRLNTNINNQQSLSNSTTKDEINANRSLMSNEKNNSIANQQFGANLAASNISNMQNLANQNINNQVGMAGSGQLQQQQLYMGAGTAAVNAGGSGMSAAQQEGQAEYERRWGNAGNVMGMGGAALAAFSDEDLKHYRECSRKVVVRSPKSIQKLKFVMEGAK